MIFTKKLFNNLLFLLPLLLFHIILLSVTRFTDWPEMVMYPWLVKQGFQVYRDFFIAYPPASVFLTYGYFSIMGFSVLSYKILTYSIILFGDIVLYYLGLSLWKKRIPTLFVMSMYVLLQVSFEGNLLWHELMYILPMLGAYWLICLYIKTEKLSYLLWASVLFGFTFLLKQTIFWTIVTTSITLMVYHITNLKRGIFRTAILGGIPLLMFGTVAGYYFLQGVSEQFLYWIVEYPLSLAHIDSEYNFLPSWKLIIQIFAPYLVIPILVISLLSKKIEKYDRWYILFLVAFCVGLSTVILPRWGIFRLQPSLVFVILGIGFFIKYFEIYSSYILMRIMVVGTIIIIFLLTSHYVLFFFQHDHKNTQQYLTGTSLILANDLSRIVDGRSLYIWGGYDYFYFLMNKKPSVLPWTQHFPWMLDAASLYNPIINQIEQHGIEYIVLTDETTPNAFLEYVTSRYTFVQSFSISGSIWKRQQ